MDLHTKSAFDGVITALPPQVRQKLGERIYTVGGRLISFTEMPWRTSENGMSDGEDVKQLERVLPSWGILQKLTLTSISAPKQRSANGKSLWGLRWSPSAGASSLRFGRPSVYSKRGSAIASQMVRNSLRPRLQADYFSKSQALRSGTRCRWEPGRNCRLPGAQTAEGHNLLCSNPERKDQYRVRFSREA